MEDETPANTKMQESLMENLIDKFYKTENNWLWSGRWDVHTGAAEGAEAGAGPQGEDQSGGEWEMRKVILIFSILDLWRVPGLCEWREVSEDVPELDLLVFNIYLKIIYLNKDVKWSQLFTLYTSDPSRNDISPPDQTMTGSYILIFFLSTGSILSQEPSDEFVLSVQAE